jgi:DNA-binding NarL/FixJ family response regulator
MSNGGRSPQTPQMHLDIPAGVAGPIVFAVEISSAGAAMDDFQARLLPSSGAPKSATAIATKRHHGRKRPDDAPVASEVKLFRQTLATAFLRALGLNADQEPINFADGSVDPETVHLALMLLSAAARDGLAVAKMLRSDWPTRYRREPTSRLVEASAAVASPKTSSPRGGVHTHNGSFLSGKSVDLSVDGVAGATSAALQHSKAGAFRTSRRSMLASGLPANLTSREMQVLERIIAGESNKEIARSLDIGLATVESHVHNLLRKLDLERRSKVLVWWYEFNHSAINEEAQDRCAHRWSGRRGRQA